MVQAGDDQRGVQAAEDGAEDHAEAAGDACHDHVTNPGADGPADGAQDEVGGHGAQEQGAEGDHDHLDD